MLEIYNTLTRKKEEFRPHEDKKVKMFVCGPTVYDYIHIGNARTFVIFDAFAKYLRYRKYDVIYLQNITDIEDRITMRAKASGEEPLAFAKKFEKIFLNDVKMLGIDAVSKYARASEHIKEIVKQVKQLIEKGNAYLIEGDGYYFDLKTFPEYGKLSGRTAEMADDAMSRIDENPKKRNKGDFCLWKFSKEGEPLWHADIGDGRPGWHIEDTAVTEHYFGPQYDIHGGGQDLIFPHHEAEIAQQESVSGLKPFVKFWMHANFLVNKEDKMSKSAGNFLTLHDALKKYSPEALRFYFLSAHYRSLLDYNEKIIKQAEAGVNRIGEFYITLKSLGKAASRSKDYDQKENEVIELALKNLESEMADDFNTPRALAQIFDLIRKINPLLHAKKLGPKAIEKIEEILKIAGDILGIVPSKLPEIPETINQLVSERGTARAERNFDIADNIRNKIESLGYEIDDTAYGPLVKKVG